MLWQVMEAKQWQHPLVCFFFVFVSQVHFSIKSNFFSWSICFLVRLFLKCAVDVIEYGFEITLYIPRRDLHGI